MAGKNRRLTQAKPKHPPLTPKVARLLREAWWLLLVALALYLAIILGSYSPEDGGWSSTGSREVPANAGGPFGAWLADLLLYLFGLSAYWWVGLALYLVWWGYRRIGDAELTHPRGLGLTLGGFALTLASSCGIESLRLHSMQASLPLEPGGALGMALSGLVYKGFGFDGGTVFLLLVWGVGLSPVSYTHLTLPTIYSV